MYLRILRTIFILSLLLITAIQPMSAQSNTTFPPLDVTEPLTTETASGLTIFKVIEDPIFIDELEISDDGNILLVSRGMRPYVLNLTTNEIIPLPSPNRYIPQRLDLSPNGSRVSQFIPHMGQPNEKSVINLWDAQTGEVVGELYTTIYRLGLTRWTTENTLLFLTCENPDQDGYGCSSPIEYLQWDVDGNRLDNLPVFQNNFGARDIYAEASSQLIQQNCKDDEYSECNVLVNVIDLTTGETVLTVDTEAIDTAFRTRMSLSPDEKTLAVYVGEGTIQLFNLETGEQIQSFDAHNSDITAMAFNPDATLLASVGGISYSRDENNVIQSAGVREEAYLRLWDTATGELLSEIDIYTEKGANRFPVDVASIAFTPDGRGLIFGGTRLYFAGVLNTSVCTITVPGSANLRALPTTTSERAGTLNAGQSVYAAGQAEGDDGFVWWLLLDGAWVRSDIVRAEEKCSELPTINP